jgi:hypothetical protein
MDGPPEPAGAKPRSRPRLAFQVVLGLPIRAHPATARERSASSTSSRRARRHLCEASGVIAVCEVTGVSVAMASIPVAPNELNPQAQLRRSAPGLVGNKRKLERLVPFQGPGCSSKIHAPVPSGGAVPWSDSPYASEMPGHASSLIRRGPPPEDYVNFPPQSR